MGEIVGFVSKSELERARLIREARAIYDSIFPPVDAAGERRDARVTEGRQKGGTSPLHRKETAG
ncbi:MULTISPECIES: hypothetical protein [unclassified Bradyrhizobium]|uniref:hypothetical protein n=1 Tax=unclassified Bradyrhizobium TaxID=2631580 RepID=UPI0024787F08|nr:MULTISPECIES: hypothetical protein [unclassified Bradyrhizobium]WGS19717.1 hypothetical protein MTX22_36130 [Bradyrhizobium sp. ISRA463]WGS26562.1 hypothetical protein MTX19_33585 [Bradyrhizobium sp. ISRA464]